MNLGTRLKIRPTRLIYRPTMLMYIPTRLKESFGIGTTGRKAAVLEQQEGKLWYRNNRKESCGNGTTGRKAVV